MIRHYFKTASRYLLQHKIFTGINLFGLVMGMCVCYFALLYVNFERSYDRYNEKAGQIYRLVTDVKSSAGIDYQSASAPMAPALRTEFPEVKAATRFLLDYLIVQKDQGLFSEENIAYADSSLFSVFTLPLVSGNPQQVLNDPFRVVLSQSAAQKYFGTQDPIGHPLLLNGKDTAYVTGIMKDMPYNSHFRVDMLLSLSTLLKAWNPPGAANNWTRSGFYTYLLLPDRNDVTRLAARLPDFVSRHLDQSVKKYTLSLEPLTEIYLHGRPRGSRAGSEITGNNNNIYIFSLLAAFVLFIACFNFINLSTAVSTYRAREIGVRKVLGATKAQLMVQFLLDALLLSGVAFLLSLCLCALLLPFFNELSGKIVAVTLFKDLSNIGLLLAIALIIGGVSGIYPAFILSRYQPVSTLKGRFITGIKGAGLRRALVTVQFTMSIMLIIATIVVYRQLHFMQTQQLGFKKEHQLVIDFQFDRRVIDHIPAIRQQLAGIPGVGGVSISSSVPGRSNHRLDTHLENASGEMQDLQSDAYFIDDQFLAQYQVDVIAGRGFSDQLSSDSATSMLLNETAVKSLGYQNAEAAIGRRFTQTTGSGLITGVIRDFHFHSFREKVQPLTLRRVSGWYTFLTLNINTDKIETTIGQIKDKWKTMAPGLPLTWFFADDAYNAQYAAEQHFGKLFFFFSLLAIGISCLGLFGLTAFSTLRRTKEIGVRKVLGASVTGIVGLLTKEFCWLIGIAFVVATPLAWYSMHAWLTDFAYRTNLSWWIFTLAGALTLLIAFITISFQTINAARANPVKSLRSE